VLVTNIFDLKTTKFLKHLTSNDCVFHRNGKKHAIWKNSVGKKTSVPRHTTIDRSLGELICKQLDIPIM